MYVCMHVQYVLYVFMYVCLYSMYVCTVCIYVQYLYAIVLMYLYVARNFFIDNFNCFLGFQYIIKLFHTFCLTLLLHT